MKLPVAIVTACCFLAPRIHAGDAPGPVTDALREEFRLDPFYQRCLVLNGFPLVTSEKVHEAALVEAAAIVRGMTRGREDLLAALAKAKIRLAVMAASEYTTDVPEHSDLRPADFWNWRARGLGATTVRPAVSCGEENLLHFEGDPYPTENILVHEFAHALHQIAIAALDPGFNDRLRKAYDAALAKGLWKNTYAAENASEYWAEGVQSWFGTNRENDAIHNHVNTREELLEYDPGLAALCRETFRDNPWQYQRSDDPARADEAHLKDLRREKLPEFKPAPTPAEKASD